MFYALKTFLFETTVVLSDNDKQPFTFYTLRSEDINLGDVYIAQITQKMPEQKAFFADIGNGRSVYIACESALKIGDRVKVVIIKEPRAGKIAQGKYCIDPTGEKMPVGLYQKGDILAGIQNPDDWQQIDWREEFDDMIAEAADVFVPFANGAQVIIERTHAFYSIDVDSHTSTAGLHKLNEQAAVVIAKEIIKRNMSGNILIDFIGSKRKDEMTALKNILSEQLSKSPVPYRILGVSPMGNLEVRRQRMRSGYDDAKRLDSFMAYTLFKDILKRPQNIEQIRVGLGLYAALTTLMQKTWDVVQNKAGYKLSLIADTKITDYKIEYK